MSNFGYGRKLKESKAFFHARCKKKKLYNKTCCLGIPTFAISRKFKSITINRHVENYYTVNIIRR